MTIEEDAACGTGEASATLKDVNMFVMFDRSWSMNECGDGGTSTPMGGMPMGGMPMGGMHAFGSSPAASRGE